MHRDQTTQREQARQTRSKQQVMYWGFLHLRHVSAVYNKTVIIILSLLVLRPVLVQAHGGVPGLDVHRVKGGGKTGLTPTASREACKMSIVFERRATSAARTRRQRPAVVAEKVKAEATAKSNFPAAEGEIRALQLDLGKVWVG